MTDKLEKKGPDSLKEITQYGLTFGVIAMMLFVANFPLVVIFFFGIFAYFLWKTFSSSPQGGVRQIFEFYLSASAILREDERRWFGFEILEVIGEGERILQTMHGAPPLVYFALGALYNKAGNHESAEKHLSYVVENDHSDESSYVHPSANLRSYVRLLRKIERDPAGAPQTAAAVRLLERSRKNRGKILLEESRAMIREGALEATQHPALSEDTGRDLRENENILLRAVNDKRVPEAERPNPLTHRRSPLGRKASPRDNRAPGHDDELFANRKPITEVLHDIYDKNIQ